MTKDCKPTGEYVLFGPDHNLITFVPDNVGHRFTDPSYQLPAFLDYWAVTAATDREFWKEADGDQLLLRPGEETIWYYAHEQDKVKRLCNDMTELLEKKLARYLNEH